MSKQFMAIVAAVVVGLIAIFVFTGGDSNSPSTGDSSAQATSHVKGLGQKGVVLIEYGDFQCPACASYYPIVKAVYEKYQKDIKVQFRHFPLVQIHQNAFAASRAAEAAGKQGKFWEMHDLLYEQQVAWANTSNPTSIFQNYASQINLDLDKYKADYASAEVNDIINADVREAGRIAASSTPTFVLDGKKLDENPKDQEAFDKLIADAIAAKN